jgi:hypothetical protein
MPVEARIFQDASRDERLGRGAFARNILDS